MPWFEVQVTLAGSIAAGHFALKAGDIDVVLLAEGAVEGALEFARHLAAAPDGPPVILMSPLLATEVEYEALSFGVAACIETSELTPRVIETYIRNALWRRAALQPASDTSAAKPSQSTMAMRTTGTVSNVVVFNRRPD